MNAQKEVEYIAEIEKLKSDLKKATINNIDLISTSDFKEYATISNINKLIGEHFVLNPFCYYKLTGGDTISIYDELRPINVVTSPVLSATRVVEVE